MKKVLLVGESWTVQETHIKGFDSVDLGRLDVTNAKPILDALKSQGIQVDFLPNPQAQLAFPDTQEELSQYSVVILSDIGSNTIMLDPAMMFEGKRKPNRLLEIAKFVNNGGGLVMFGGYLSFSGIENKARYAMTPLADVLPVKMLNYDDRIECPQGINPIVVKPEHPVLQGIETNWPHFLGYNKIKTKKDAIEIMKIGDDTFMACGKYGNGRTFAFASDCTFHWGSREFLEWNGYPKIFANIVRWLAKEI
ncbi:MAG: glutamine amidotransferase [Saccharofermentanales bacterium]|jgi:uncharacterized membrane protein